jgi:hypothetical protein
MELRNLCFSSDIVRMMKSMRMILEGHVALMGEEFKLGFDKKT